jgi:hypothetical protein
MKMIILQLVLSALFITNLQAQKVYDNAKPLKRHMCAATIVGMSSLTVGVGMTVVGLGMEWAAGTEVEHGGNISQNPGLEAQYQHDNNTALAVRDVGLVLGAGGLVLLITGVIGDRQHNHKPKFSLVAPKKNAIGLAYNF